LAHFSGSPEKLLKRCRQHIEEQGSLEEQANLLAVSQVLARLRFPQQHLLALLGGRRVMIESPLIQELMAEQRQDDIVEVLAGRFGAVPEDVLKRLRQVTREKELKELLRYTAVCPDLAAFLSRLPS
jgi:predicted transposase YdaD